jgi:hypothetical protein
VSERYVSKFYPYSLLLLCVCRGEDIIVAQFEPIWTFSSELSSIAALVREENLTEISMG